MALAHLEVTIFTRRNGDSAVEKAAYRAGQALHDERIGLTHNYSRKRHVEDCFVLAPPNAPSWVCDRERLWNAIEARSRRHDSQLARHLEISLPRELNRAEQHALLESFIAEHFVSRGMVADCAIHRPPPKPGRQWSGEIREDHEHNPHAHVMLTMRDVDPSGFGNKNKDWDDWDLKNNTRLLWELAANRALAAAGRPERIDMRSFEDQGLELEAQPKGYRSPTEVESDGRGHVQDQAAELQAVARRNGDRLLERPEIVLELLAAKQAVFTEHQILRALHRYTADRDQFDRARFAVFASAELVELSADTGPRRFSTRATVASERSLLTNAHMLAQRAGHRVREANINAAIAASLRKLSDEQAAAVRHLARSGDLALVQGYAGTGKSTMLAAARAAWQAAGFTVVGGALAGKAAEGLADPSSAGIPSRTLASWQWAWGNGRDQLTAKHILVIDEAGMVGTRQLEAILAAARAAGAKVVLVGDTKQLQAIEPGAPMRALQDQYGAIKLTNVIRQNAHAWQAEATRLFAEGKAKDAIRAYVAENRTERRADAEAAQRALIERWAADRLLAPTDTNIVLAYRRKDVRALNELARSIRQAKGELGPDHTVETMNGPRTFAQGDRIYFLKNDRDLGVTNGTLATIELIEGSRFTVRLDDQRQLVLDAAAYGALDHGYAATVHKSQGVTVDRAYVLASRYLDASATYVAMSRHRKDAQLFYAESEFADDAALVSKLSRQRASAMALDDEPRLPAAEKLDQVLKAEHEFLALSPEAQLAELDKCKVAGNRPTRSAAEVLELLPEVRAAAAARDEASAQLALATRELQDFREQHPVATELRTSAFRAVEAACEVAQQAMLTSDRALTSLRADAQRRQRAEQIASRHNLAIKQARERWQWCSDLRLRHERDVALGRYAAAANLKRGDQAFRVATRSDEGRSFEVVLKREVRGEPVFILRSPRDGRLVIADARLFPNEPVLGTSAVLVGRVSTQEPDNEKGPSHGRSR